MVQQKEPPVHCTVNRRFFVFSNLAENPKVLATNRKAFHDYFVEETFEAGIALTGTEIKSVRAGAVNLRDAFAQVRDGEVWLQNVHISPYEQGNRFNVDPYRTRKLLMHRKEINRLMGRVQEKGLTIVPLRLYLKKNRAKVEIALVKGKKQYDKRESISKRDAKREMERAMKVR
ncbi:MAG: SsrA-binding protein SmpB [Chloroflexi bacterium]|nr:SsrA-binding protein SmpB [Chloroflexota bacterium]